MKRLVAILLSVLILVSLTACTVGTDGTKLSGNANSTEETEAPKVDINKYDKTLDGMIQYLQELKLISKKDGDKTETAADMIGAKKGYRVKVDATNFVEFYEIDVTATPDEALNMTSAFANGDSYKVIGVEEVNGFVSGSGKFVMLYPATSTYDYSEIKDEFMKF